MGRFCVCVCVLSEQSELKLWLHSEDLLWNTESLTDHIIISMQSLNMCNVQTHSNSCVNVSSHEYVSRPIKFEIIQTVLLNKLYTKQSSPLIFWQTLAIVLRNVEGSHTHILVSYFPHPRLWVAKHTHEKPQRGTIPVDSGSCALQQHFCDWSRPPSVSPSLKCTGCVQPFQPTHWTSASSVIIHVDTHTHNWDQMFTL